MLRWSSRRHGFSQVFTDFSKPLLRLFNAHRVYKNMANMNRVLVCLMGAIPLMKSDELGVLDSSSLRRFDPACYYDISGLKNEKPNFRPQELAPKTGGNLVFRFPQGRCVMMNASHTSDLDMSYECNCAAIERLFELMLQDTGASRSSNGRA